jgi:hypothetical protein
MRKITTLLGASVLILGPALGTATPSYSAPPATGSISPNHETGQQVGDQVPGGGLECEDGVAPGSTTRQHEQGAGSPFQEDSVSGSNYAGEKTQNQKNTASVSQYDISCFSGSR